MLSYGCGKRRLGEAEKAKQPEEKTNRAPPADSISCRPRNGARSENRFGPFLYVPDTQYLTTAAHSRSMRTGSAYHSASAWRCEASSPAALASREAR